MSTRAVFAPGAAELPTANYATPALTNNRPVLLFDAATPETVWFTTVAPQGLLGPFTMELQFAMVSATTGNFGVGVAVEAITPGDALDLATSTNFDSYNNQAVNVPATAGNMANISVTLAANGSMAAGDYLRFAITRDAGTDTATGDAGILTIELRDSA